jgi:hypothetical protein
MIPRGYGEEPRWDIVSAKRVRIYVLRARSILAPFISDANLNYRRNLPTADESDWPFTGTVESSFG